MLKQFHLEP